MNKLINYLSILLIAVSAALFSCDNVGDDVINLPVYPENPDDPDVLGSGTEEDPYTIAWVLKQTVSATDTIKNVWVKGYIVGAVNGMAIAEATFDVTAVTTQSNFILAASKEETDYTNTTPVALSVGTVRDKLNLVSNPGNFGALVTMQCSIVRYFGVTGIKEVVATTISLEGATENPDVPEASGDGSESKPYNVAAVKALNPGAEAVATGVWAEGYIVGYRDGNFVDFFGTQSSYTSDYNLFLADSKDAKVIDKCISIQITASYRAALGLMSNPSNMGKKVAIKGDVMKYNGIAGVKNMSAYKLEGASVDPETPDETTVVLSYGVTSVNINEALNCVVTTAVTNGKGNTVITASGMPAWVTFKDNGDGTASLSGTAPATEERSEITLSATNNNVTATKTFTLRVVAPGAGLIANGGFENWSTEMPAGWSFKSVDGVTYAKENGIRQAGAYSVKVNSGEKAGTANITADRIQLEPGDYTYSFYYYLDASTAVSNTFRAWGMIYDDMTATSQSKDTDFDAMKKLIQPSSYVPTDKKGEWVKYEINFSVPKTAFVVFEVRFYKGTAGYVDSVELLKK